MVARSAAGGAQYGRLEWRRQRQSPADEHERKSSRV